MHYTIRARFDGVLGRHFDRLIGTRQGIGGIPLNLASIGCILLLGGRESDLKNSLADSQERYTRDTLLQDAADLGIGPDDSLGHALQSMLQNRYCEVDAENRFFPLPPIITTIRLFDRIFPKMKGINFLAFIGQTMEEAMSGRTNIEAALSRLDQTLHHHGVPFSKDKPLHKHTVPSEGTKVRSDTDLQNIQLTREYLLAELYRGNSRSRSARPSLRVLSGGITQGQTEIKAISQMQISSPSSISALEEPPVEDGCSVTTLPHPSETHDSTAGEETLQTCTDESASMHRQGDQEKSYSDLADQEHHSPLSEEKDECDHQPETTIGEYSDRADDAIADRIAAFENNLAMMCPVCNTNTLKEHRTTAGKAYYTCSLESCNFISWGKPHHTECRRCKNPFLIEMTDAAGKTMLKCPRATCQHRHDVNPAKQLVRKRLVRRKKQK